MMMSLATDTSICLQEVEGSMLARVRAALERLSRNFKATLERFAAISAPSNKDQWVEVVSIKPLSLQHPNRS
ncbi:hypothetical protein GOP47_0004843 [Adiantum capillus-veneris]|uniref:Uncharacterized protein n=1 Tax=Adiantum capillus-veneris TaxID=13818 RepID=A0A9D4V410_ADICA|nr:hypothetical protein GOP47_0004843 [Adiantum capillus-veneris]